MVKLPHRYAYCQGKLGLLVSRHWHLRFCSRLHKEAHLRLEQERLDDHKRWLGYLEHAGFEGKEGPLTQAIISDFELRAHPGSLDS
jgi:hypothetical protein